MASTTQDTSIIRKLYEQVIEAWNERKADEYAALFVKNANVIGFDGSVMNGTDEIESQLSQIFDHHMTARYVTIIREIRFLNPDTALLWAAVGMVSPNATDLNPAANAIQSMVATKEGNAWYIALFHNTPAQFHGRPDAVQAMTDELRSLL